MGKVKLNCDNCSAEYERYRSHIEYNKRRGCSNSYCSQICYKAACKKKLIDLTGQKFGRLIALKRVGNNKKGGARWLCVCDCGKEKVISSRKLRHGDTRSCGCIRIKYSKNQKIRKKREHQRKRYAALSPTQKEKDKQNKIKYQKHATRDLKDFYVRKKIVRQTGLKTAEITPEIIEFKRQQILLTREIRKAKGALNGIA